MKFIRYTFLLLVAAVVIILIAGFHYYTKGFTGAGKKKMPASTNAAFEAEMAKLNSKASSLETFLKKNDCNRQKCFLIDMSLPSGKNRFFVYNLKRDSIELSGVVTHGRCNQNYLNGRQYSNKIGSGCTSLGRYKVGYPYQGRFGLAYKLFGLDSSNSNAFNRFVVLHSHDCVPSAEVDPNQVCQSDGCPTVSPAYLGKLQEIIDDSPKPIVMYIFE